MISLKQIHKEKRQKQDGENANSDSESWNEDHY